MKTEKSIDIITDNGQIVAGKFTLWEEAPENPDFVQLELRFADEEIIAISETYFEALLSLRKNLQERGFFPKCFGASRDVFPSPMIRHMGSGEKAYRLRIGCPARVEDIVCIFDTEPSIIPTTVEAQEVYYLEWLRSLGNEKR